MVGLFVMPDFPETVDCTGLAMPRTLRARWLDMLRDPTTRQCTHALKDDGAYCVLGALCHVARILPIQSQLFTITETDEKITLTHYAGLRVSATYLLVNHAAEFGLNAAVVEFLCRHNDTVKWTLPRLADWIDDHIPAGPDEPTSPRSIFTLTQ